MEKKHWTKENCRVAAMKSKTLRDFRENYRGAYQRSLRESWLSEFTWLERRQEKHWSFEKCKEIALHCTTLNEFRKNERGAYLASYKNDWLKNFDWLIRGAKA